MDNEKMFELLEIELKKEASRIFDILFEMYTKKEVVNLSFEALTEKYMKEKYFLFSSDIKRMVMSLIPLDLYICPNKKWVLVTREEYDEIVEKEAKAELLKEEKMLRNIASVIACEILKRDLKNGEVDFFDVASNVLENDLIKGLQSRNQKDFLLQCLISELEDNNKRVVSVSPLVLEDI